MAGAAYLREMHDRYGNARAMLAAYNAGPGRYDDYLSRGRPLPTETVGYLAQLAPIIGTSGAVEVAATAPPDRFIWRRAALFVRTAGTASSAGSEQSGGDPSAAEPSSASQVVGNEPAATSASVRPGDGLFVPRARAGRPQ